MNPYLDVWYVGGELVVVGGRVLLNPSAPRNGGEGGEQLVTVLVCLHQQEVAQDHRLQLLLLPLLHFSVQVGTGTLPTQVLFPPNSLCLETNNALNSLIDSLL